MSLDVYLYEQVPCPHCGELVLGSRCLYEANITHNLGAMADAAGIYTAMWRPEEAGLTVAGQLVPVLQKGLAELEDNPDKYRTFNAPNGWGTYDNFVPFVRRYLEACVDNPTAAVSVSR